MNTGGFYDFFSKSLIMRIITTFLFFSLVVFCHAQEYDQYVGAGHSIDVTVTSSDPSVDGMLTVDGSGLNHRLKEASRFLASATLGATIKDIAYVSDIGFETWIDEQMNIPRPHFLDSTNLIIETMYDFCVEQLGVDSCRQKFRPRGFAWRYAWWHNTMTGKDLLRQRVALALSEILVISDQSDLDKRPRGLSSYYDILSKHAFGNYYDLLYDVTLSVPMGFYLSHLNNPKTDIEHNTTPDENYAREIMQLFTIGLYELNNDGTKKLDDQGRWIPTYDTDDIRGLAKVFTGLSGSKWRNPNNESPVKFGKKFNRYDPTVPMKMYENYHEPGEKVIVGDYTIPAGQSGMEDITQALQHLFNHPNVGPFIGYRLIQRLVKSNPSPAYIRRVAEVFEDNGQGIRGDLGAVVKAILLDEEARACYNDLDQTNGKLFSPFMRYRQFMSALQARTESRWFWNSPVIFYDAFGQHPLSSPTVFNFYLPNYEPNADFAYLNAVGPEFQIHNSSTSSNYVNFVLIGLMRKYLRKEFNLPLPKVLNQPGRLYFVEDTKAFEAVLSDEKWLSLADKPEQLVDYLDILLAHGQLSDETKANIVESISRTDVFEVKDRPYYAAFLILIHP